MNYLLKKCSPLLAIKEVKIKTMLRFYHLTPVRTTTIKNPNKKFWRSCWEKEPSYTVGRNVN
jgi:hypothetical protein